MNKKDVVINVEPFYIDAKFNNDGSLIISLTCDMKSEDVNKRKIVNVKLRFWCLSQLAKYIHTAIRKRREYLQNKLNTVQQTEDEIRNG